MVDQFVVFDPHSTNLPGGMLGLRSNFIEEQLLEKYPAQMQPFQWIDGALDFCECTVKEPFGGTLFRLPLRTKSQAAASKLADTFFELDDLQKLLDDFADVAAEMLLFLRNVEEISIHVRHNAGSKAQRIGAVSVADVDAALRANRWLLPHSESQPEVEHSSGTMDHEMEHTFEMQINRCRLSRPGGDLIRAVDSRWLLHWHQPLAAAGKGQIAAIAEGLGLTQWVCVAAKLPVGQAMASTVDGCAYCFLPLPIKTGLQVHINAAFALSSNRRDLWSVGDTTGAGALKGEWNRFLLEEALPEAYVGLLRRLGQHLGSSPSASCRQYMTRALPDLAAAKDDDFKSMVARVLQGIVSSTGAVDETTQRCRVLWDSACGTWISFHEATLEDSSFQALCRTSGGSAGDKIRQVLISSGMRLVTAPAPLLAGLEVALEQAAVPLLQPNMVAEVLRKSTWSPSAASAQILLQYLLDDCVSNPSGRFKRLLGLKLCPLLPRSLGKLGTFQSRTHGASQFFFVCPSLAGGATTALEMLPGFPYFVDPDSAVYAALSSQECLSRLNIAKFGMRAMLNNMHYLLNPAWKGRTMVRIDETGSACETNLYSGETARSSSKKDKKGKRAKVPHRHDQTNNLDIGVEHRLALFWDFVETCGDRIDLRQLSDWPLVTVSTGRGQRALISIDNAVRSGVVCRRYFDQSRLQVLDAFNCMFLDENTSHLAVNAVHGPADNSVVVALRSLARNYNAATVTADNCRQLRDLVLGLHTSDTPENTNKLSTLVAAQPRQNCGLIPERLIRSLPIFETVSGQWAAVEADSRFSNSSNVCIAPSQAWTDIVARHCVNAPILRNDGEAARLIRIAQCRPSEEEMFISDILPQFLQQQNCAVELCVAFLEAVERCSRGVESLWKRKQERRAKRILDVLHSSQLILCDDGNRRTIRETIDPDDPELELIYSSHSAERYPADAYRRPDILKVMRKAGMGSLSDGDTFVQAARFVASKGHIDGGRVLLLYLAKRTQKLSWSNAHFAALSKEPWVPAQSFKSLDLPPTHYSSFNAVDSNTTVDIKHDEDDDGAQTDDDETCGPLRHGNVTVQEIRERIRQVYARFNRHKVNDVESLMQKYRGKEVALYTAVCKKYLGDSCEDWSWEQTCTDHKHAQESSSIGFGDNMEAVVPTWQLVSLDSGCCMWQDAALGWRQLMVLAPEADRLPASLCSRLRLSHPYVSPSIVHKCSNIFLACSHDSFTLGSKCYPGRVQPHHVGATLHYIGEHFGRSPGKIEDGECATRVKAVVEHCANTLAKTVKKGSKTTASKLQQLLADCPFVLLDDLQFVMPVRVVGLVKIVLPTTEKYLDSIAPSLLRFGA
eukprot:SAG31_NODE_809_length_11922_cov_15.915504_6_plen_1351_part_00